MARANFRVEQGIEILETNGTKGVWLLKGDGAPPGTAGETDNAPIGSLWQTQDGTGLLYRKEASTSSATDWQRFADEGVYTLIGTAFDAADLGTFTGTTISDNVAVKVALQELETALEAAAIPATSSDAIAAATPTVVNTCLVDNCNFVEYEVWCYETADETKREGFKIVMLHDGESGADATAIDESVHSKVFFGGDKIAGLTFTGALTGAAGAQTIGLQISATAAITVKTRRTELPAL